MRHLAEQRGGTCLSESFHKINEKILWNCPKHGTWFAMPGDILRGGWCPVCRYDTIARKKRKYTIEGMQELAHHRGGRCLSDAFISVLKNLDWQCAYDHIFSAMPHNVMRGTWCRQCNTHSGERICRMFFEQLFNDKFPQARLPWMKNPDGRILELDGYCVSLSMAFEHQGIQHFNDHKFFHTSDATRRTFADQQTRDAIKRTLCHAHGVTLIEVPSVLEILGVHNIKPYIRCQLIEAGIPLPLGFDTKIVDLSGVYANSEEKQLSFL